MYPHLFTIYISKKKQPRKGEIYDLYTDSYINIYFWLFAVMDNKHKIIQVLVRF